jgi:hypothetical protein
MIPQKKKDMGCIFVKQSRHTFFYKPPDHVLTAQVLIKIMPNNVKSLDLHGHKEVNDEFILELTKSVKSETLVSINLSGTNITCMSLLYILSSPIIGTRRYIPILHNIFKIPYANICLDIRNTKIDDVYMDKYKQPVHHVIKYKTTSIANGIKTLSFYPDNDDIGFMVMYVEDN